MKNIYFESVSRLKALLNEISYSRLFVLTDTNTQQYCLPIIEKLELDYIVISIPAGERYKNLSSCETVWQELTTHNADRNALLINLGGGVITDLGGFCASTYKRGIRFINIPTTLLAQVDASVGSKTGIDFNGFKNHIGLFSDPEFVLIDTIFHKTLANKQLKSGFAEMLKHALIRSYSHWENLMSIKPDEVTETLIKESVAIKYGVVQEDPRESGIRKTLNVGHTIGHALESFFLETDQPLLHGEAIGIGIQLENMIAVNHSLLSEEESDSINQALQQYYDLPSIKAEDIKLIGDLCLNDKKNDNDIIMMSLVTKIGEARYNHAVEIDEIYTVLKTLSTIN